MGEIEGLSKLLPKLFEFAFVYLISSSIGSSVYESFIEYGYDVSIAGVVKWIAFFVCLLVYYRLIKVKLKIKI